MSDRRRAQRALPRVALLGATLLALACEAAPSVGPEATSDPVAMRVTVANAAAPQIAEVFAKVDRIYLQIRGSGGAIRDTTVATTSRDGRLRASIFIRAEEMVGAQISAELRVGAARVFAGNATIEDGAEGVLVPVNPIPAFVVVGAPRFVSYDALGESFVLPPGAVVFSTGDTIPGLAPHWTSDNPAVAAIGDDRVVRILGNGQAALTATHGELNAAVQISVAQVPATITAITPGDTVIAVGDTLQFRAIGVDPRGNQLVAGATIGWRSESTAVTITESGLARGIQFGHAVISAGHPTSPSTHVEVAIEAGRPLPSGEIAFADRGSIYVTDMYGNRRAVAGAGSTNPSWAPDHSRFAYVRNGRLSIRENGRERVIQTPRIRGITWPEFSADGQWIYFIGEDKRVNRVRLDGSGLETLAADVQYGVTSSPSGDAVAYRVNNGLTVQPIGDAPRFFRLAPLIANTPKWSPSGEWISFVSDGVWVIRPDGTGLRRLVAGAFHDGVSWSPDGRWLVAVGSTARLIEFETGMVTALPFGEGSGGGISWWR
jgi:sugar lactone lactonase YvrE